MATMLKKHINFLSSLLLVLFAFPKSNAMPTKDVYSLCKESSEVDFCMKNIGSDKRIVAARDFYDIFLIAVSRTQIIVDTGLLVISGEDTRKNYNEPFEKNWVAVCEEKYKIAVNSFQKARVVGEKKSKSLTDRMEMSQLTEAGFEAVLDCQDEWTKILEHEQACPFSYWYHKVRKLVKITRVIVKRLNA
ncbi:Plant invertase/pectin methylesterase inhibitor superfamily protein [Arabidopsis thaliana]|uniref:Plant invertase/pectin methylesterase inhibitor superfamily protein n=3 Tax=Arabidopsis thaliana TaxID=3702 RepID=A0A1P8AYD6_ARATH|nr:Plant invertase/pectin methylesterase inhibitor superfamily protein [Arabidopsis thaliana]ANM61684.1 Plant invertase/pectin methylesterase inhibitor superfamily protein [Arabidopsis thaliana]|eukprot:NP_001323887.1 Plant invertase/pectin methylesterase inhibitor superfamily protein [Arabidopsis thaliana]